MVVLVLIAAWEVVRILDMTLDAAVEARVVDNDIFPLLTGCTALEVITNTAIIPRLRSTQCCTGFASLAILAIGYCLDRYRILVCNILDFDC